MTGESVGFVGGGRIVRIILGGWRRAGVWPARVLVHEPNAEVRTKLKAGFPEVEFLSDSLVVAADATTVFLAVHPPDIAVAVQTLAGNLRPEHLLISLAPKVNTTRLAELLGGFSRIARTIPNAASLVNAGYNPVAFAAELGESEKQRVLSFLQPLGACPVVPENHLEAYAVLTGMGPTYFWFQFRELQQLGSSFGLPSEAVNAALSAMIRGAALTFFESGLEIDEILDLIPVKPLADAEESVGSLYRTRLPAIYQKLTR